MLKKDAGKDAFKYSQSTACATHSGLLTCVKSHPGVAREFFFCSSFFSARVFPLRRFLQPFSGYQTPNTLFALRTLGDWGRESSLVLALVSDDKYYLCIHVSMGCLNHKKLNLVDWKGKKADLVLPTAVMSTEI